VVQLALAIRPHPAAAAAVDLRRLAAQVDLTVLRLHQLLPKPPQALVVADQRPLLPPRAEDHPKRVHPHPQALALKLVRPRPLVLDLKQVPSHPRVLDLKLEVHHPLALARRLV